MPAHRLAVVRPLPAVPRPYILRFVESATRAELAYPSAEQRDAHAAAVVTRGCAVTLAFARGAA